MKTAQLITLFIFTSFFVQAQKFNPNQYSLKDYKAPNIRYQTLIFDLAGNQTGSQNGTGRHNNGKSNYVIYWYQYKNLTKYQGATQTSMASSIGNYNQEHQNSKESSLNFIHNIYHQSTNRFYNESNFIGIHPMLSYYYGNNSEEREFNNNQNNRHSISNSISFNSVISVGKGRIEPITAARDALDILTSLSKYNRLAKKPSNEEIDTLAQRINDIKNKRFFDIRYKRIYQLQEIDSVLQNMGIVENIDMVYAANLSDIWNYGITGLRGSGSRFEFGFIPEVIYREENSKQQNLDSYTHSEKYGGFIMANWTKIVPINFKWQSSILIDGTAGWSNKRYTNIGYSSSKDTLKLATQEIKARWVLGYFPNTRTYINFSPTTSITFNQDKSEIPVKDKSGIQFGADFNSYYYLSPKFRISLEASILYRSNEYYNTTPYYHTRVNRLDQIRYPNGTNLTISNGGNYNVSYDFNVKLSYAIF